MTAMVRMGAMNDQLETVCLRMLDRVVQSGSFEAIEQLLDGLDAIRQSGKENDSPWPGVLATFTSYGLAVCLHKAAELRLAEMVLEGEGEENG